MFADTLYKEAWRLLFRRSCLAGVEYQNFVTALIQATKPRSVLDIGTHHGLSAAFFACHRCVETVHTIDLVPSSLSADIWKTLSVTHKIKPHILKCDEDKDGLGIRADFALVDGGHAFEAAKRDYGFAIDSKCKHVLFHDCTWIDGLSEFITSHKGGEMPPEACGPWGFVDVKGGDALARAVNIYMALHDQGQQAIRVEP